MLMLCFRTRAATRPSSTVVFAFSAENSVSWRGGGGGGARLASRLRLPPAREEDPPPPTAPVDGAAGGFSLTTELPLNICRAAETLPCDTARCASSAVNRSEVTDAFTGGD
jgi:hypothetical protein